MRDFLKSLFIFIDRGEGREKEKEKNIYVWLPLLHPLLGKLAWNSGMCPDWELNWWPFGSQACAQSTELHQPGPFLLLFLIKFIGATLVNKII